jgi:hypothetical protein
MVRHVRNLAVLISEYDAVLKLARDRGTDLSRHPDVDKLDANNSEDLDFIEGLIERIRRNVLMVPPARR